LALIRGPIARVARDLGVHAETPHKRVRQAEGDGGRRKDLVTTDQLAESPAAA
jgi:transposase-like protein